MSSLARRILESLDHPDAVGQSQYRALYEQLEGDVESLEDDDLADDLTEVRDFMMASVDEMATTAREIGDRIRVTLDAHELLVADVKQFQENGGLPR